MTDQERDPTSEGNRPTAAWVLVLPIPIGKESRKCRGIEGWLLILANDLASVDDVDHGRVIVSDLWRVVGQTVDRRCERGERRRQMVEVDQTGHRHMRYILVSDAGSGLRSQTHLGVVIRDGVRQVGNRIEKLLCGEEHGRPSFKFGLVDHDFPIVFVMHDQPLESFSDLSGPHPQVPPDDILIRLLPSCPDHANSIREGAWRDGKEIEEGGGILRKEDGVALNAIVGLIAALQPDDPADEVATGNQHLLHPVEVLEARGWIADPKMVCHSLQGKIPFLQVSGAGQTNGQHVDGGTDNAQGLDKNVAIVDRGDVGPKVEWNQGTVDGEDIQKWRRNGHIVEQIPVMVQDATCSTDDVVGNTSHTL